MVMIYGPILTSFRGLRQGDPLSSFLVIIVTEALRRFTKKLEESGLLPENASRVLSFNIDVGDQNLTCLAET